MLLANFLQHEPCIVQRGSAVVNSTAADKQVSAEARDILDIRLRNATIDSQNDISVPDQLPGFRDPALGTGQERLPAPTRVDRKQQDQLEIVDQPYHRP